MAGEMSRIQRPAKMTWRMLAGKRYHGRGLG
jgi:hypothetical protein